MFMITFRQKSKIDAKKKSSRKWQMILGKSVVGVGILLLTVLTAYHFAYRGKVYPRVIVGGMDVSNKTVTEAQASIEVGAAQAFKAHPAVPLVYDHNEWDILKGEVQFAYQPVESAQAAYRVGRSGNVVDDVRRRWNLWFFGTELPLQFRYNQQLLDDRLASVAAEITVPPVPPSIEVLERPTATREWVRVIKGESGQTLQLDELKQLIMARWEHMSDEPVILPLKTVTVNISDQEVQTTKERAEKLVKRKLRLSGGEQTVTIDGQTLINFLDFHGGFDVLKLHDYVITVAKSVDRAPQNGAFQYVDGKVTEFRPAKDGWRLQQDVAVKDLWESLAKLETGNEDALKIELAVAKTQPDITLDEVNNLGIKELLGKGTSTYRGSIPGRVHNVGLSASRINGALVAPGETFSFNQAVGEISGATGYQQAYVIRSGATVLDDGGGVCQSSTTLFRAVLNAGLPVVERKAHSYRVGYYEQNAKAGLDATVFAPTADLKFINDTPGHILIQTSANAGSQTLVVEIYGTADGRVAEITNHRIWDIVPAPPPRYQEDPSLPAGTTKQVDWAAAGAKAKFDYTVKRNGEVIYSKTFLSVFRPWQAVYLRGTGG